MFSRFPHLAAIALGHTARGSVCARSWRQNEQSLVTMRTQLDRPFGYASKPASIGTEGGSV